MTKYMVYSEIEGVWIEAKLADLEDLKFHADEMNEKNKRDLFQVLLDCIEAGNSYEYRLKIRKMWQKDEIDKERYVYLHRLAHVIRDL